jgi:tetratricopeptide (TPR) repeat protein
MTTVQSRALPPPLNWQDFERLAFDLYSRTWKTSDALFNGRSGQPQAGVDVFGTDRVEKTLAGVQCKGKDGDYGVVLTAAELKAEVEKAKTYQPALEVFILATTAPDDVTLQTLAREITKTHKAAGLFEVRVEGWGSLKQRLTDYPDLVQKHFPDLAPISLEEKIDGAEDRLQQGIGDVLRTTNDLKSLVAGLLEQKEPPAEDDPLKGQIALMGELINQGTPEAALRLLMKLDTDKGPSATARNRYRLRATIGSALLNLDRQSEAADAFAEAYALDPQWHGAIAFGATAALIRGQRLEAHALAQKAFSLDPSNAQAASVIIDTAPASTSLDTIADQLGPDLLTHLDLRIALSLRATRLKDPESAARHAQAAFEIDPEDWRALSAMAETILPPIFSARDVSISHRVAPGQAEPFATATAYLQKAWDILKVRSDTRRGIHVAANLVSALDIDDQPEAAARILAEALQAVPDYAPLLRRQAEAHVGTDDWISVRAILSRIPPADALPTDALLDAQVSLHSQDPADGLRRAKAVYDVTTDERLRQYAAAIQIEAATALGEASESVLQLMDAHPASVLVRSAAVSFLPPDNALRARALEDIRLLTPDLEDPRDIFHAAEAFYLAGEFSMAADLFARVTATDKDTLPLRRLVASLHNAKRRREARELFDSLPVALQRTPRFAEMGSIIYDHSGMLPQAKTLLEAAIAADPADLATRLSWMHIAERMGRSDEAVDWLSALSNDLQGSPEDLMRIATAMDRLNVPGPVLPLAYRALRAGYSTPAIHTNYMIGLFLMGQVGKREFVTPEASGPDVAVRIDEIGGDRSLTYVLETEPDPRIERQEIGPENSLWAILSGLRIGDRVELPNLGLAPTVYEVGALSDKYVHAHHRSMQTFTTLFPGDQTFGQFTIEPEKGLAGFGPLLETTQRHAERARQIEEFYKTGSIPLSLFAKFAGTSGFNIWDGVSEDPRLILMTCVGSEEELSGALGRMEPDQIAVIDPITLYGLTRMGITDLVLGGFTEVGLVQGTIDLLRGLVHERRDAVETDRGSLHATDDVVAFVEKSEELSRSRLADAEAALARAETLTVFPSEPLHPINPEALGYFDAAPSAYANTVFAAQHARRVLLCDDRALRLVAESGGRAQGVWSQAVIAGRSARGEIGLEEVAKAALAFLRASSTFTMVSTPIVLHILNQADWSVTDDVGLLIDHIVQPMSDRQGVVTLWSEILVQGWFTRERAQLERLVAGLLDRFAKAQSSPELAAFANDLVQAVAPKMTMQLSLSKRQLLETTSLSSLPEMRKPARMAAYETTRGIGLLVEAAMRLRESSDSG